MLFFLLFLNILCGYKCCLFQQKSHFSSFPLWTTGTFSLKQAHCLIEFQVTCHLSFLNSTERRELNSWKLCPALTRIPLVELNFRRNPHTSFLFSTVVSVLDIWLNGSVTLHDLFLLNFLFQSSVIISKQI